TTFLKLLDYVCMVDCFVFMFFFFQAEDGIRDRTVTGVQTCALPIYHLAARESRTYLHKNNCMKLKFYGTRGSIPICDAGFQKFGGNPTCLQITLTDTNRIAIIDARTGLRYLVPHPRAIGHRQEQLVIAFTHL